MKLAILITDCFLLVAMSWMARSQAAEEAFPAPFPGWTNSATPPIVETSPGLFLLGQVQLNKKARTITVPAIVNLRESPVEYLLVTSSGKIHESVLRTEAEPLHIHLAMLLLGAKGAGTNAFPADPSAPLPGDPVEVAVHWKEAAASRQRPGEDFVFNRAKKAALSRGDWTYTGSCLFAGTFLAQQEGSIIALFTDPVALINNPRPGREDDENWLPQATVIPPEETPVNVTIRLRRDRPEQGAR